MVQLIILVFKLVEHKLLLPHRRSVARKVGYRFIYVIQTVKKGFAMNVVKRAMQQKVCWIS